MATSDRFEYSDQQLTQFEAVVQEQDLGRLLAQGLSGASSLEHLLTDPCPIFRNTIVTRLGILAESSSLSKELEVVLMSVYQSDAETFVRAQAAFALARNGKLASLCELFWSDNAYLRELATIGLQQLSIRLIHSAQFSHMSDAYAAHGKLHTLRRYSGDLRSELFQLMSHPDYEIKREAAEVAERCSVNPQSGREWAIYYGAQSKWHELVSPNLQPYGMQLLLASFDHPSERERLLICDVLYREFDSATANSMIPADVFVAYQMRIFSIPHRFIRGDLEQRFELAVNTLRGRLDEMEVKLELHPQLQRVEKLKELSGRWIV